MKLSLSTGLAAGLLALAAAPAVAAPVTVDLRIEGRTQTLFEGPVTTDIRPFVADDGPHECDGSPPGSTPGVTRGAVVSAAALAYKASWSQQFGSPSFTEIAGENVEFEGSTGRFLAEYYNGVLRHGRGLRRHRDRGLEGAVRLRRRRPRPCSP